MTLDWLLILGFFAQGLFGARSVVQWYLSEREGRVVSPTLFWVFSLTGSSLFLIYGLLRQDVVILIGQTISFYIYVRNLQLKKVWSYVPMPIQILLLLIPPAIAFFFFKSFEKLDWTFSFHALTLLGITGQLLLNCRYLYQWYFSEKAHESICGDVFHLQIRACLVGSPITGIDFLWKKHHPLLSHGDVY
jgi:lipid-A-disaccharide synthase-like uncharacterized protein